MLDIDAVGWNKNGIRRRQYGQIVYKQTIIMIEAHQLSLEIQFADIYTAALCCDRVPFCIAF